MFYFLSSLLFALETWINKNLLASQVFATYLWKQDLKKKKKNYLTFWHKLIWFVQQKSK